MFQSSGPELPQYNLEHFPLQSPFDFLNVYHLRIDDSADSMYTAYIYSSIALYSIHIITYPSTKTSSDLTMQVSIAIRYLHLSHLLQSVCMDDYSRSRHDGWIVQDFFIDVWRCAPCPPSRPKPYMTGICCADKGDDFTTVVADPMYPSKTDSARQYKMLGGETLVNMGSKKR